ncbi:MAG TPA: DMT family transporter, partial [Spirochaetia bacterium]|nr:DMT family transporter [Spirochaetia bacterium]
MAIKTSEVNTSALFAESMLVVTTLLWGSTFVVIKTGLNDASPLLFLCLRFALALAIGCFLWRKKLRTINRATLLHGLLLGFFMFGGYGSQTYGLAFTTVAKSGLFTYVYALITPALQYLLVRKPLRMGNLIGLLIVVSGMLLFTHPSAGTLNVGDWVTLGGAGLFAFYVVLLDRYTSTEEPVQLLLVQFFTTSLL